MTPRFRFTAACVCVRRGDGPEGCGLCNETGRRPTNDVADLTHEELAVVIADADRRRDELLEANNAYRDRALTAEGFLRARFGSIAEGHFAVIELEKDPTEGERQHLSRLLSRFVEETSTRFLVLAPGHHARAAETCDVCKRSLK